MSFYTRGVDTMPFTLGVLVDNESGVLARVAGLISRRGYNIQSLAVGPGAESGTAWITLCAAGDDAVRAQVERQLAKLVEVCAVRHMAQGSAVERELALIKVRTQGRRPEVLQVAETFRAAVVDLGAGTVVLEATGATTKVDALLDVLGEFGVLEVARTGPVAMLRGEDLLCEPEAAEGGRPPPATR